MELDPRNVYRLEQVTAPYWSLRRYPEARKVYDRALAIEPNNVQVRIFRADLDLAWKADTRAVHQVIESLRDNNPRAIHEIADSWVGCALADRDPTAAKAALIAAGENTPFNDNAVHFSHSFVEGWIARLEKDEPKARVAFESARSEQERIVAAQPDYAPPLCVLGVIDAALGRKQEALSECRRAVELLPVEKDAFNGPLMIQWFAISAAWVGEKDLACEQLAAAIRYPGSLAYGQLKLLPFWDPLRGDPRFEKIVQHPRPRAMAPLPTTAARASTQPVALRNSSTPRPRAVALIFLTTPPRSATQAAAKRLSKEIGRDRRMASLPTTAAQSAAQTAASREFFTTSTASSATLIANGGTGGGAGGAIFFENDSLWGYIGVRGFRQRQSGYQWPQRSGRNHRLHRRKRDCFPRSQKPDRGQ